MGLVRFPCLLALSLMAMGASKTFEARLTTGLVFEVPEDATVAQFKELIVERHGGDVNDFIVCAGITCCPEGDLLQEHSGLALLGFNLARPGRGAGPYELGPAKA